MNALDRARQLVETHFLSSDELIANVAADADGVLVVTTHQRGWRVNDVPLASLAAADGKVFGVSPEMLTEPAPASAGFVSWNDAPAVPLTEPPYLHEVCEVLALRDPVGLAELITRFVLQHRGGHVIRGLSEVEDVVGIRERQSLGVIPLPTAIQDAQGQNVVEIRFATWRLNPRHRIDIASWVVVSWPDRCDASSDSLASDLPWHA